MEPMGLSFMPGQDEKNGGGTGDQAPVQDAIRTLNLSIPRVVGSNSPINASLLNGAGSQGLPGAGGGIEAFLRRLFGQIQQGPISPGGAQLPPSNGGRIQLPGMDPGAPAPNFSPGVGGSVPAPSFSPGMEAPVETPSPFPPAPRPMPYKNDMDIPRDPSAFGSF